MRWCVSYSILSFFFIYSPRIVVEGLCYPQVNKLFHYFIFCLYLSVVNYIRSPAERLNQFGHRRKKHVSCVGAPQVVWPSIEIPISGPQLNESQFWKSLLDDIIPNPINLRQSFFLFFLTPWLVAFKKREYWIILITTHYIIFF